MNEKKLNTFLLGNDFLLCGRVCRAQLEQTVARLNANIEAHGQAQDQCPKTVERILMDRPHHNTSQPMGGTPSKLLRGA